MKKVSFNEDQIIFRQGAFENTMFDILSGRVGIFADYDTEKEIKLAEFEAGQVFGEIGMIGVYPRTATAVAMENETVLAEIEENDLQDYFKNKPEQLLKIMKQISKRLRETNQKYIDACRAVYETASAEENGEEKNEWLINEISDLCSEYAFYTHP